MRLIILGCFLFFANLVYGFEIRCISVFPDGTVVISWDRNLPPGGVFQKWEIYHSSDNLVYTLLDSITVSTDTIYSDALADANNSLAYYFIEFHDAGGNIVRSDTASPIGLYVANPGSGYANLAWSPIILPPSSFHSSFYQVYREYPIGTWTLIDSVDILSSAIPMTYSDTISVCNDTINYRIQVQDLSGCVSVSSIKGDRFRDLVPPSIPQLDSVSVDPAGNVMLGWSPSPSLDASYYIILHNSFGAWDPIDTVYGRTNTFLITTYDGDLQSESFRLIAVDSCNNPSAQGNFQKTLLVNYQIDRCAGIVKLDWNPYLNWQGAILYEIYKSTNGGVLTLLDTTSDISYIDSAIVNNELYCYSIVARLANTTRSSTSNSLCFVASLTARPTFSYIRSVSAISYDRILVHAHADFTAPISKHELYRATNPNGPFKLVAVSNQSGVSSIYMSDRVRTAVGPYYYKVETYDSCGVKALTSQLSQSIVASVSTNDYINSISWTPYKEWPGGVEDYYIFRKINDVYEPNPIAVVSSASTLQWIDTVTNLVYAGGEFCYTIKAVEAAGNPYGFADTSISNEVCIKVEPIVFIPNAFHPGGGLNETFRPSNAFVRPEGYSMDIYNRWGQRLFHSGDPDAGWDGTFDKGLAPPGMYIYLIKMKNPDGEEIKFKGGVMLIRN